MKKVNAIIERGKDGTYDVYIDSSAKVGFGLLGQGSTVKEAIDDFLVGRDEMKELYEDEGKSFPDLKFNFQYDMPSFLNYYSDVITLAGLGRLTGVNQYQLSHYATGLKRPRPAMVKKIETSLHNFSRELSQVHFYV